MAREQLQLAHLDPCPLVANHGPLHAAMERAIRRVVNPYAPNTQRAYELAIRQWQAHCNEHHVVAAPIEPSHLVVYLESRRELAPNTVRLHLAALCSFDLESRAELGERDPLSLRHTFILKRWLKSWSRDNPSAPRKQAPALQQSELIRILVQSQERTFNQSAETHLLRYARDRAIFVLGVLGAFRGAELAELDVGDVREVRKGLEITVRRSKTDQEGRGQVKCLAMQARRICCPIAAWGDWLRVLGGKRTGPAFVAIGRDGTITRDRLRVQAIRRIVTKRAAAAGISVSSHSLRATFVTLAREAGRDLGELADQGGWQSLDTVRRYTRTVDMWRDNVSEGVLDDDREEP